MNKPKLLTIAVLFLLAINFLIIGFFFFGRPPHGRSMDRMGPKDKIIEVLNFDSNQVREYEKLIGQHRTSIRLLNDHIQETKSSLYQALEGENSSTKDSLINKLGALQVEIETIHYNHFIELKKICRPNQLGNFKKLTGDLADFFNPENRPAPPRD
ncbi:MAG: hypothetical protein ACKODM_16660 [Cytophagales bacterium]